MASSDGVQYSSDENKNSDGNYAYSNKLNEEDYKYNHFNNKIEEMKLQYKIEKRLLRKQERRMAKKHCSTR